MPAERILLDDTAAAVERLTDRLAGPTSKTIHNQPIKLEVFKHGMSDLTLVDLPGITRVALDGGNGEALEQHIKELVLKYVEPKESVILNVVSAMVDLATSAAVQMSLKVDPEAKRSLLCVTMVDKHKEPSTLADAIKKACGDMRIPEDRVFAVCNPPVPKRGNPAQESVTDILDDGTSQRTELQHLQPLAQAGLPGNILGVAALVEQLVIIQSDRIKQTLPAAEAAIKKRKLQLEAEAKTLGEPIEQESEGHCRVVTLGCIDSVVQQLRSRLAGQKGTANGSQCGAGAGNANLFCAVGESFEVMWHLDDLQSLKNGKFNEKRVSDAIMLHGMKMQISIRKGMEIHG